MAEANQGGQQPNANAAGNETHENEQEIVFSDDERSLLDEETTKKVDSLFGQKKHWREKAKKLEEEHKKALQELETLRKPPEKKEENKSNEKNDTTAELQRLRLKTEFPQMSYEDIDKAVAYSKLEGTTPQDVINSDFFQGYLKNKAEKAAAANAAPGPSNRSGSSQPDFAKLDANAIAALDDKQYADYQKWLKAQSGGRSSGLRIAHTNNL